MLKKTFVILLLGLTFLAAQFSFADSTEQVPSCNCNAHMKKILQSLNLDQNQITKIKAIKKANWETMKTNWQQVKAIRAQIKSLVLSDTLDETALNKLINQKSALMNAIIKDKIMAKNQIYNLLNTNQKQQYRELLQKWESQKLLHQKQCQASS